jgi:plastocyanin
MSRFIPIVRVSSVVALAALAGLSACGGGDQKAAPDKSAATITPPSASAATGVPITPDPGGKIIVVELTTDDVGSYFKPAEVHAKRGDVVRYTLKVGVHNIHFLPDSNAGRSGYPEAPTDMLQLPGQTWDVAVKMPAGSYYFQCDPHAALGMKGKLIVE